MKKYALTTETPSNTLKSELIKTFKTYEINGLTGVIFGNDECFDVNEFYQYFISGETLYQLYYELKENLDEIDYENPYRIEKCNIDEEDLANIIEKYL